MNRLTGWVSKHNVCHVELYFPTLDQCFSVQSGGVAQLRHKQLSNPGYTVVTLGVSRKEYDDCLCFCRGATGIPFADAPMLRAYLHGLVTPTPVLGCAESSSQASGATFCSKIPAVRGRQGGGGPAPGVLHPEPAAGRGEQLRAQGGGQRALQGAQHARQGGHHVSRPHQSDRRTTHDWSAFI